MSLKRGHVIKCCLRQSGLFVVATFTAVCPFNNCRHASRLGSRVNVTLIMESSESESLSETKFRRETKTRRNGVWVREEMAEKNRKGIKTKGNQSDKEKGI